MATFLRDYGTYLFWGIFLLVMFLVHGRGGGCCGTVRSRGAGRDASQEKGKDGNISCH